MLAVTGATGRLGGLVIAMLSARMGPAGVVGLARTPAKLAHAGVTVRQFDYDRPETLVPALQDVERLLLISSSEIGHRLVQHLAVIAAAKQAGVRFIAYTSLLRADECALVLGREHFATEQALEASGIPHAILRHGWYSENFLEFLDLTLAQGALTGCSGDGRFSAASRTDFAEAATAVMLGNAPDQRIFELAGDLAVSMSELAALISTLSGREIIYRDMPPTQYAQELTEAGILPLPVATKLAEHLVEARSNSLVGTGDMLRGLIGRPLTPLDAILATALAERV